MQNIQEKLIELHDVNVHYTHENMERTCAMRSVDLTINHREHIAIIGKNGSGKSTLLRVLRGEIYPDQVKGGSVAWYEKNAPEYLDNSPLVGRAMTAIVSPKTQEYYATQAWNVNCEEIIIAAKTNDFILYKKPSKKEREEARTIASMIGAEHLLSSKISVLSQGQLRIILIARALIRRAPVLLLDEALNGLDVQSQELVIKALQTFVHTKESTSKENLYREQKNTVNNSRTKKINIKEMVEAEFKSYCPTIVMTSHRLPVPSFIKKAYTMSDGILMPLNSMEVLAQPEIINVTDTQILEKAEHAHEVREVKILPVEKTLHELSQKSIHISLKNASAYIDHTEILHSINWEIQKREQWAVQGVNGSGKSTLLSVILGFIPVALGGSITRTLFDSVHPKGVLLTELATIKQHIRLVSDALQTHYTYNDTVEDIVFCGLDGNIGVYRHPSEEETCLLNNCLEHLNLNHLRKRKLHSLSTGQARRALLARAIIGEPSLLLLDEPFSGLDISSRQELTNAIEKQVEKGVQTILVSHHQEDLLPSTTHLAIMKDGYLNQI